MKTESILLQSLCVPCSCRCRYCLLSWDGTPVGAAWARSVDFAWRFHAYLHEHRPDIRFDFAFGYSMEHPALREALRFLRRIGSPQSEFLQCDGMRVRGERECRSLAEMLAEEGVTRLNFTFYGLPSYHDRFAGRAGDFELMLRMIKAAVDTGLTVSSGIPVTAETVAQANQLVSILKEAGCEKTALFVPHEEGRGVTLAPVRLTEDDFLSLSSDTQTLLNRSIYRTEREWIAGRDIPEETKRAIIISLRNDTIERYEKMTCAELIAEVESLDDAYYASFPAFPDLAERYGDPNGKKMYRQRDLFSRYRRMYAEEFGVSVYDVTDERQSGSRRY